jgi:hypothetical protein
LPAYPRFREAEVLRKRLGCCISFGFIGIALRSHAIQCPAIDVNRLHLNIFGGTGQALSESYCVCLLGKGLNIDKPSAD